MGGNLESMCSGLRNDGESDAWGTPSPERWRSGAGDERVNHAFSVVERTGIEARFTRLAGSDGTTTWRTLRPHFGDLIQDVDGLGKLTEEEVADVYGALGVRSNSECDLGEFLVAVARLKDGSSFAG
jgi:hypothetical protein